MALREMPTLSPDETMLVQLMADGYTREESLLMMSITPETRHRIVARLYDKFDTTQLCHVVGLCVEGRLVSVREREVPTHV